MWPWVSTLCYSRVTCHLYQENSAADTISEEIEKEKEEEIDIEETHKQSQKIGLEPGSAPRVRAAVCGRKKEEMRQKTFKNLINGKSGMKK